MKRWTARIKLVIVHEVRNKRLTRKEACRVYGLSLEELELWIKRAESRRGREALQVNFRSRLTQAERAKDARSQRAAAEGDASKLPGLP